MSDVALDLRPLLADLRRVPIEDFPGLRGDSALEATLRRLQAEAEGAGVPVISAFQSAI
jgi:FXSXX-COOH protein